MGLLDDAIREHLDLKRRSGGDPAEVARLEHEALGPVRREPEPAAAGDAAAEEHAHVEHHEPAHEAHEHHEHEPAAAHHEPHHHEPPAPVEEHHEEPASPAVHEDQISWAEDLEADHPPAAPTDEPDEPTGPDEDVLEETPEFLQETPEHDRLWFEQRPPRDFDFDG